MLNTPPKGSIYNTSRCMYEELTEAWEKRSDFKVNAISEKAHTKKLGWEIIDEFEFNNNSYIELSMLQLAKR